LHSRESPKINHVSASTLRGTMKIRKAKCRQNGSAKGNRPETHGKKWPGRHEASPGQVKGLFVG
jgi:hypothetical protein